MIARPTHRKYANYEHYEGVCEDGSSTAILILDEKDEEVKMREIQDFMKLSGAVKMFRVWTARGGHCREEVVL